MLTAIRRSLWLSLVLVACSKGTEPLDPIWGKQACGSCRMLVSDPKYAAELVDQRGERHFFDDIGCLDAYLAEHAESPPRAMWVRSGARWVEAESARYASGEASPMDYGFVARELGPLDFVAVRRGAAAHRHKEPR